VFENKAPSSKAEALAKDKPSNLGLIRSKNPNADFNNPNNPNYKGRLAGKIIESYLPKQKAKVGKVEKDFGRIHESPEHERRDQGREREHRDYFEEAKQPRKKYD